MTPEYNSSNPEYIPQVSDILSHFLTVPNRAESAEKFDENVWVAAKKSIFDTKTNYYFTGDGVMNEFRGLFNQTKLDNRIIPTGLSLSLDTATQQGILTIDDSTSIQFSTENPHDWTPTVSSGNRSSLETIHTLTQRPELAQLLGAQVISDHETYQLKTAQAKIIRARLAGTHGNFPNLDMYYYWDLEDSVLNLRGTSANKHRLCTQLELIDQDVPETTPQMIALSMMGDERYIGVPRSISEVDFLRNLVTPTYSPNILENQSQYSILGLQSMQS